MTHETMRHMAGMAGATVAVDADDGVVAVWHLADCWLVERWTLTGPGTMSRREVARTDDADEALAAAHGAARDEYALL